MAAGVLNLFYWAFVRKGLCFLLFAVFIFVLAGLAEIGGGYMVWLWLRESRPLWYGIVGSLVLIAYGIIPTLQSFPSFGRVYAAYGGVFVVLAVLWGWLVDKKAPDMYDWIGAAICLIGVSVMLWAPRSG
ncbi:small multidrug resistance family-3 protein [Cohnella sp. OV330]|nr:small multidrug resistance family-3 protein [Cohnella sp. OV330]